MTVHLRDRLADELAGVPLPTDDLATATIRRGHVRLRARRLAAGAVVAAAVALGATVTGAVLTQERPDVADASTREVRALWDARVATVFDGVLPADFSEVTQVGGGSTGEALQFVAGGPRGGVTLSLEVYVGSAVPRASCDDLAEARRCQEVGLPDGTAAVARDVHSDLPDLPRTSLVVVEQGGVRALVNVVELSPGPAQWSFADLLALAQDPRLGEAVDFAEAHAAALRGYATFGPDR